VKPGVSVPMRCVGYMARRRSRVLATLMRGFTLIELMVTIGILAVLLTIAIPSFTSTIINYRLTSISNTFVASAQLARSEAIKRNGRVTMCKSADGAACVSTGGWEQGWILFHDIDNDAVKDAAEVIIKTESALPANYVTTTGDHYISFTANGGSELTSGAAQATTVTLCSQTEPVGPAKQIVMNFVGRVRIQKYTATTCVQQT
jgi:type IV fimbrial biogenesis protein FimT